jgi:hypothetical protein
MPYPVVAGPLTLTSVANSVNPPGTALYTGTVTGGTANAYAGYFAQIWGFPESTGSNNSGTTPWLITNSSATAITVQNPNAVSTSGQTATLNVFALNSTGPFTPSTTASGATTPFPNPPATGLLYQENTPSGASLTPRNFENDYNFVHDITSTQESINGANGIVLPQQGTAAITNVTSVALAGYTPGQLSFVQFTGAYQKA